MGVIKDTMPGRWQNTRLRIDTELIGLEVERAGMTASAVARRAGLCAATVRRILGGQVKHRTCFASVRSIAKILGLRADQVIVSPRTLQARLAVRQRRVNSEGDPLVNREQREELDPQAGEPRSALLPGSPRLDPLPGVDLESTDGAGI
jgi:transcriptional regulator with XRE-family HTH domain